MDNPIIQALEITGIGMGLVFVGILALWAVMALLVHVFRDRGEKKSKETPMEETVTDIRQKAAAAAVAVALSIQDLRPQAAAVAVATALAFASQPAAETPTIHASSWQIVNRMTQINLRNQTFTRKSRGN